jgi:hypothetical protein
MTLHRRSSVLAIRDASMEIPEQGAERTLGLSQESGRYST